MPCLRRRIPGLPRNSTGAYLRRLRRVLRRRRRRALRKLRWLMPGAVWAIDGTWLDQRVGRLGRRALVVVELQSTKLLVLKSVRSECIDEVLACLQDLVQEHGAPLVLKLDNGSAFISAALAEWCATHGITLLHSPVRRPSYNGTCEVSGRWGKHRAYLAARARGAEQLEQQDLDHAVTFRGVMNRISDDVRARFQAVVAEQLALVRSERGLADAQVLRDDLRRSLARVAVRRALELCHILSIEGREFPQCLPASAA
jgi:transposase InsO family protein